MPETTLALSESGPIRRFTDAKIGEAVDKALAAIPADKKGAVLAVANKDGARLVAAARLTAGWSIVGVLEKPWSGELKAEVATRFVW